MKSNNDSNKSQKCNTKCSQAKIKILTLANTQSKSIEHIQLLIPCKSNTFRNQCKGSYKFFRFLKQEVSISICLESFKRRLILLFKDTCQRGLQMLEMYLVTPCKWSNQVFLQKFSLRMNEEGSLPEFCRRKIQRFR